MLFLLRAIARPLFHKVNFFFFLIEGEIRSFLRFAPKTIFDKII